MRTITYAITLIGLLPLASHAAVTITEVAWMGDTNSANHEWIELYNSGSAATLSGWILTDNDNLSIDLSGTIPASSYAVLERTSDGSAAGTAFLIYTGALKNSGATLTLYRADGSIADQVAGGTDWSEIGGDNSTKFTAQYTTSGWITAVPTPGTANEAIVEVVEEIESEVNTVDSGIEEVTAESTSSGGVRLVISEVDLELALDIPEQVFVNQPVTFSAQPNDIGKTIERSLRYQWNFGDTYTSHTQTTQHTYSYPGNYVVHITAEYAEQKAAATKEIVVLPTSLSLTQNRFGDIQINNDAAYPIDISHYRVRANDVLAMPDNTWVLPKQTITVAHGRVGYVSNQMIGLYDNSGELVASIMPQLVQSVTESIQPVIAPTNPSASLPAAVITADSKVNEVEIELRDTQTNIATPLATTSTTTDADNSKLALLGLIALLLLASAVVLLKPLAKSDSLDRHE